MQLKDTRSNSGYYTLLHYLVNLIEEKRPELMKFADQLPHLKSGVKGGALDTHIPTKLNRFLSDRIGIITTDVNILKKSLVNIETELKIAQKESGDIFAKKITVSLRKISY